MRRIFGILIAIFLAAALPGSVAAAPVQPRVAVIVGPAEGLTDLYRSIGAAAAREARRWTSDVVTVFSPNATWPVVKRALRGASVVIYLGHGCAKQRLNFPRVRTARGSRALHRCGGPG